MTQRRKHDGRTPVEPDLVGDWSMGVRNGSSCNYCRNGYNGFNFILQRDSNSTYSSLSLYWFSGRLSMEGPET